MNMPTGITRGAASARSGLGHEARTRHAFTLLEVMFAVGIFFLAVFSIMGVVSTGLGAAGRLQSNVPDAGWVIADIGREQFEDGGSFEGDFGDFYPDFTWKAEMVEYRTNSLFLVNIIIRGERQGKPFDSQTELLLWRPSTAVYLPSPGGRR